MQISETRIPASSLKPGDKMMISPVVSGTVTEVESDPELFAVFVRVNTLFFPLCLPITDLVTIVI